MTHPLAGFLEVDESARTVRHYRYVTERMMRILGGWIALTPELSAKLLFGRHVWDNAQHADAWGKRLPELSDLLQDFRVFLLVSAIRLAVREKSAPLV